MRTAEQFIAAEGDQIHAGPQAVRYQRLVDPESSQVHQAAAAQVLIHWQAALPPQRRQVAQIHPRCEPGHPKIAGMHAQKQTRALIDGGTVIVDLSAIGGAHFAQRRTGPRHNIGNSEAVADFDQFTARHYHLAVPRKLRQCEKDGRGIIVDGDRRGSQEALEKARGVSVALAPASGSDVVFEVGVAGERIPTPERCSPQIGMQHDTGSVDDAAQRRPFESREPPPHPLFDGGAVRMFGEDFRAHLLDRAANLGGQKGVRIMRGRIGKAIENLMHRGQIAQFLAGIHDSDGTRQEKKAQQMVY